MKTIIAYIGLGFLTCLTCVGQSYNLPQLLKENKLTTYQYKVFPISDTGKQAISNNGIVWLKDVLFSNGTIEIDLRGQDIFQRSFIGVAFHGIDTVTYDAIYFRPFNFRAEDPERKVHAVQYISEPDYPWHRLRKEFHNEYEKGITPAPAATDWFHARILVNESQIEVFVNDSATPSLTVRKLNTRRTGLIGLWHEGESGDFANLVIKK